MGIKSEQYSENQYTLLHEVGPNQHGIRLDLFLKRFYVSRSRELLKKEIGNGSVSVRRNQGSHLKLGRLKPSSQLIPGDQVTLLRERMPEPEVSFDYRVLFEDDSLFVIEKPANLPVHPAGRYFFNTLIVHLKTQGHQTPLKMDKEFFLVHRIDKETSGVLVLAKTREVCTHLIKQFAKRTTEKLYLAIVLGTTPEKFTVDRPIRRALHSAIRLKMEAVPEGAEGGVEGGMTALTDFKRLTMVNGFSLLECRPKTGRQHQIRVHLDFAGFPIVGDKLYGRPEEEALRFFERKLLTPEAEAKLLLPRHALHAAALSFEHPASGTRMTFNSELPEDMRKLFMAPASTCHLLRF